MRKEISAGGIIVRNLEIGWEVLLICDMNKNWTFPKGIIEPNEKPEETAEREIAEEVGLTDIKLLGPLTPIEYMYVKEELVEKKVFYSLFESKGYQRPTPQVEEGITATRWLVIGKAKKLIGYPKTNLPLLDEASDILLARRQLKGI